MNLAGEANEIDETDRTDRTSGTYPIRPISPISPIYFVRNYSHRNDETIDSHHHRACVADGDGIRSGLESQYRAAVSAAGGGKAKSDAWGRCHAPERGCAARAQSRQSDRYADAVGSDAGEGLDRHEAMSRVWAGVKQIFP